MTTFLNDELPGTTREKILAVLGIDEQTFVAAGLDVELAQTVQWLGATVRNNLPNWPLAVAIAIEDLNHHRQ
jgi:hypothetical protein